MNLGLKAQGLILLSFVERFAAVHWNRAMSLEP